MAPPLICRRAWLFGIVLLAAGAEPPAPSPPTRVMIIGDSQAQGLAAGLQNVLRGETGFKLLDRSRISTGLRSAAAYDWPAETHGLAEKEHAAIAVVMFGANDRPPVRAGGHIDATLLKNFRTTYGAHVRSIVDTLTKAHAAVIWVGHPIVRDPAYAEDMAVLNGIFADVAVSAGAQFVSLWETFQGADHSYTAYGPGTDGDTTRLRADDGVHLTPAGYKVAAKLLQPLLQAQRARMAEPPAP